METIVNTKKEVLERIRHLKTTLHHFGVKRIGLFGSFVRDASTDTSDIDFLVEFEAGKKSFDNFMQLSFILEEALSREIELVTIEALSPYIGPHILEEVEYVAFND